MTEHNIECRRQNAATAAAIDRGIAYLSEHGYPQAKIYLMEHAIRPEIIRRVLKSPEQRRPSSAAPSL
jgi:hypothetical protein